jgi:hypothetical protein
VVDGTGKRIGQHVVETSGAALIECLRMIPGTRRVCIEEGTQSSWLYEILSPHVQEMIVMGFEAQHGPKSDERDAFGLAERLRIGAGGKRVFKDTGPYRVLRELARIHQMVVWDVVRVQSRLKSIYRSRGIDVAGKEVYRADAREVYLARLPQGARAAAHTLYTEYDVA